MKLNGAGGMSATVGNTDLSATDYVGICPVQPTGGGYAQYYCPSILISKILGVDQNSDGPHMLAIHTYAAGPNGSSKRCYSKAGIVRFEAGSAGLQTLNFVCSVSTLPIIAGTKFIIYGVEA